MQRTMREIMEQAIGEMREVLRATAFSGEGRGLVSFEQ